VRRLRLGEDKKKKERERIKYNDRAVITRALLVDIAASMNISSSILRAKYS